MAGVEENKSDDAVVHPTPSKPGPAVSKSGPSLVNPDFTGLQRVVRYGEHEDMKKRVGAGFIIFFWVLFWQLGFLVGPILLFLLYMRWTITFTILFVLVASVYIVNWKEGPFVPDCLMQMSHWFAGGISRCCEEVHELDDTDHPTCVAIHPHGIFCFGFILNGGTRVAAAQKSVEEPTKADPERWAKYIGPHVKPRITTKGSLGATGFGRFGVQTAFLYYHPTFNWVINRKCGVAAYAEKKSFKKLVARGTSFGILPGGFEEVAKFRYGRECVFAKDRKGFIKYLLQHGYRIRVGYIFGESYSYVNLMTKFLPEKLRLWLSQKKIPLIAVLGPYWYCPLLPYQNTGLHMIYAKTRVFPKIDNPTKEDIEKYHSMYTEDLKGVYERNKWRFGMDNRPFVLH